jgi:replicative DNA helicase
MLEVALLKILSIKSNFDTYRHSINPKSLAIQSTLLLKDYQVYFELYKTEKIDFNLFYTFFFNTRHPYLDDKSIEEYKEILNRIDKQDIKTVETQSLIRSFEQQEFYYKLKQDLDKNIDSITVQEQIQQFNNKSQLLLPNGNIDMDLTEALVYTDRTNGLQWRCQALRDYFNGGLIQGDFGIIAGYVDSGKSSFIASELSYMAQQIDNDDYLLWLSNEGDWKSILPRLYCATLGCTQQELTKFKDTAIIKYIDKMKGNKNRVEIRNIQGWSAKDVELLVKKRCPTLLVIDLMDNLKGFDRYSNSEGSFELYNRLYQWGREIATNYCPVLGVSQMNGDGEDEMYPKMSKLRGSRVDKQMSATFQLMIGSLQEDNSTRYLSMPKDKVTGRKGWKAVVKFDPLRSRYV